MHYRIAALSGLLITQAALAQEQFPDLELAEVVVTGSRSSGEDYAGRTEVKAQSDLALSVVNPERYRYAIMQKIAQDAGKLRSTVGTSCTINVSGLENRVLWQRSDISELTLYIPYEVELSGCQ